MQHLARFEELLSDFFERRGGDYQTLLAYGRVWRDDVPRAINLAQHHHGTTERP